mmetsp:Transcript_33996/g.58373  ORF Transcript_33996/g.58373 Transcript_33996/m.58373 type:complete len:233 (+) Transcript_33996:935-1633(+)
MAVTPPASTKHRLTAPVSSRQAFISAARAISHASPRPRHCEATFEPPPTHDATNRSSPSAGACVGAAPTPATFAAVEFASADAFGGVGRAKRRRNSSEKSRLAIAPVTASRPTRYTPGSAADPVASSDDASSPATSSVEPGTVATLGPTADSAFFPFFPFLALFPCPCAASAGSAAAAASSVEVTGSFRRRRALRQVTSEQISRTSAPAASMACAGTPPRGSGLAGSSDRMP